MLGADIHLMIFRTVDPARTEITLYTGLHSKMLNDLYFELVQQLANSVTRGLRRTKYAWR